MRQDETQPRRMGGRRRRGMAMVLVLAVTSIAAVLAMAMLASATLQAEIGGNLSSATTAEYAADSGVNAAMYYLQYPGNAPASWTANSSYTLSATGVPLSDGTTAQFDVTATPTTTANQYTISATGYGSTGSSYTHTATATVNVPRATILAAGVFGGPITIPASTTFSSNSVTGAYSVQANGTVTNSGGTLTGATLTSQPATVYVVPSVGSVNFYGVGTTGQYTTPTGATGVPQALTNPVIIAPIALGSNPGAVFYYNGNLSITTGVTINGTVVVRGGTLTMAATSANVTITPKSGYPAVVCEQQLVMSKKNTTVTCNGVVYLGTGLAWSGSLSATKLAVNGALLMPAGATLSTASGATTSVLYSAANVGVTNLSLAAEPGTSVQAASWTP